MHTYYDLGFDDAECSTTRVINEARLVGFIEGWVALNEIPLFLTSPYRDLSKVPLPKDPLDEEVRQEEEAGEGRDGPNSQELLEEIEAHISNIDVMIVENPNTPILTQPLGAFAAQTTLESTPPVADQGHSLAPQVSGQSPNPASYATKQRPNPQAGLIAFCSSFFPLFYFLFFLYFLYFPCIYLSY